MFSVEFIFTSENNETVQSDSASGVEHGVIQGARPVLPVSAATGSERFHRRVHKGLGDKAPGKETRK